MQLNPGARLGPYEIVAAIGAGGMGEVYRARDTALNRDVALKILSDAFAGDPDRLARFTREAQTLASLNHPHIAAIYGLEAAGGVKALVMELVEGEDLSAQIARGPIPLLEALSIATQIATALEAAHEAGVVHRDLKPANVKVRADGTVKVLDFGLAKATGAAGAPADAANSPTLTIHGTAVGVIIGTAAYMAPEQARGKAVDKRADIWAFGVVLYEMLTGRAAFAGDTITDIIAAVVTREPDWTAVPTGTPASIRHLLARCLDRDPKTRLRDIGEARVALAKVAGGTPDIADAGAVVSPSSAQVRFAWISTAAMGMVTLMAVGVAWFNAPSPPAPPASAIRLAFVTPENLTIEDAGFDDIVVSPDGTKLVFTAREGGGKRQLWVRSLSALDARPLPDTEDALEPFWSADSQSVGFAAAGKLQRVDVAGRRAQTLADAARLNNGASWSREGVIIFNPDYGTGLYHVAASGGPVTKLRVPGQSPSFLPDGRHFIYTNDRGVFIGSLDSADDIPLPGVTNRVFYAANPASAAPIPNGGTGWLVFVRSGELMAQPFNAGRLALTGDAIRIDTDATATDGLTEPRRFVSVSDTGVMVLQYSQARDYQLLWVDREGKRLGTLGPVTKSTVPSRPSISPDGTRVVIQRRDPKTRAQDIWVSDLVRGTLDRVTTGPLNSQAPVWSADGQRVYFQAVRNGVSGIYQVAATGGREQLVLRGTVFPHAASPDGRFLLYFQRGQGTRLDLWALPLAGTSTAGGQPIPLLDSPFDESAADLSPDGRWLAYASDVTGTDEVYVRSFEPNDASVGDPVRVSIGSGTRPRWRHDGSELFYAAAPDGGARVRMMSVMVKSSGAKLELGTPSSLFTTRMLPSNVFSDFVTRDGQRFLVGTILDEDNANRPRSIVVLNWMADLERP
jgi:eukaryotic-like serine/threonine-protein kinase